jgi:hypothetical protein
MNLKKHPNGTVAKYNNKRAIVQQVDNDDFLVGFKRLKEKGDEDLDYTTVEFDKKTVTMAFRITKESAIALCASLLSELQEEFQ